MSSSAQSNEVDLSVIRGGGSDPPGDPDAGVTHGAALMRLARATVAWPSDESEIADAFNEVADAISSDAAIDAVCVAANFDGITRVADATGTELDELQQSAAPSMLQDLDYESLRTD